MARRFLHYAFVLSGAVVGALLIWPLSPSLDLASAPAPSASAGDAEPGEVEPAAEPNEAHLAASCPGERPLSTPTGKPPRLSCREARAILDELSTRFAGSLTRPRAREVGNLVVGWLDRHGLWSAAPDPPLGSALKVHADELMAEMQQAPSASEPCSTALSLGSELST